MSDARNWILIVAVMAIGLGLAMPKAYAFDPQPDPPAKIKGIKVNTDKSNRNSVQPGSCGTSCPKIKK
jgi:hypothetical protein